MTNLVKFGKGSCFITLRFKISSLVWNKLSRSVSILQNTDENAIDFRPIRSSTDLSDILVSSMDFSKCCNLKPKFLLIDSALAFALYKKFRRLTVSWVRLSQAKLKLFKKILVQKVSKYWYKKYPNLISMIQKLPLSSHMYQYGIMFAG